MSARSKRSFGAVLVLLVLGAGAAPAQEPAPGQTPPQPAAAAAPAEPAGFSLAEVTVRTEEARKQLKELASKLGVPEAVQKLDDALPERIAAFQSALENTRQRLQSDEAASTGLVDLEREWQTRKADVRTWREQLTRYGSTIDQVVARLEELAKPWKATRSAASEAGSASVVERADAVLAEIEGVSKQARERVSDLIARQDRLAALSDVVDDALDEVHDAQDATRSHLIEPDSPPLWKVARGAHPRASWQRVVEQQRRSLGALSDYFSERGDRVAAHLFLMVVTLLVAAALGRRVRRWSQDEPQLAETARVLRDPFSVALLVGLVTYRLFYPLPPAALSQLMGLLLLIPAVTLLPRLVSAPFRPVVYALALLYFAAEVRTNLSAAPLLHRGLHVLELAGTVVFLLWLLRPARLHRIERPGDVPRWLGTPTRLLVVALVFALAAAVFGYTVIARVIGQGILISAYAGALLYAFYRVLGALLSGMLHTAAARRLRVVRVGEASIQSWMNRLLRLGGFLWWLEISTRSFGVEQQARGLLAAVVTSQVEIGSVTVSLGELLLFAGVVAAAFFLSRFARFVLEEDVFPRVVLRRGVSNAISTTVHYSILLGGFLLAVAAAGMDVSNVTLLAGAFGVGIGFGLQNVVNNFVSGLILLFERPIQVGDTIEVVGGLLGEVRRIGPRSSTVRTFDGAEVIVPNGMLISDQVVNWTLSDRRRRVAVNVGVRYGTDPERVLELLREVARENETVLDDPTPLTIFSGFGDSSLDFELRCWIPRYEEGFTIRTQLLTEINAKLRDAGIEIPFPQRDLHLRSVDEPAVRALEEAGGASAREGRRFRLVPDEGGGSGR
jgi:potassium efflux system protein